MYCGSNGNYLYKNKSVTYGKPLKSGDVVGIYLDYFPANETHKLEFFINGERLGLVPSLFVFPVVCCCVLFDKGDKITLNSGLPIPSKKHFNHNNFIDFSKNNLRIKKKKDENPGYITCFSRWKYEDYTYKENFYL